MLLKVLSHGAPVPSETQNCAYLVKDAWDDWWRYNTQYFLTYVDNNLKHHDVGFVKIGQTQMGSDQSRPELPDYFEQLDAQFFSVGQDESYYEALKSLGGLVRVNILRALNDIAFDDDSLATAVAAGEVTSRSLLRSVSMKTVTGQFKRLAGGGVRVTPYSFAFLPLPQPAEGNLFLSFDVFPESQPPTNVHVLIGRNGVGKSRLLHQMTSALASGVGANQHGEFIDNRHDKSGSLFANVVSVSFSAFDDFEPIESPLDNSHSIPYSYVGLKNVTTSGQAKMPPKSPEELSDEFGKSVKVCLNGSRHERWARALQMLESDPIFHDAQVARIADDQIGDEELQAKAVKLFEDLSSGHKIVLLTITRLVETVEEGSLVLLDEPEAHLHPPLLAAFIHVLSDLLQARNGVAIVVTHSPVILQEVPRSNTWILRRSGRIGNAERPRIETFAENVGVLTREVFGLEAIQSGFHRVLGEAVDEGLTYDQVLDRFGAQLGGEGRLVVQSLIALKDSSLSSSYMPWSPNVEG